MLLGLKNSMFTIMKHLMSVPRPRFRMPMKYFLFVK